MRRALLLRGAMRRERTKSGACAPEFVDTHRAGARCVRGGRRAYNYLNQLRKVWRKSDGDSHGLIAEYQEDAFGRRVLAKTYWEVARRCYFDSRIDLDINFDAEGAGGDTNKMKLIDGGLTSRLLK